MLFLYLSHIGQIKKFYCSIVQHYVTEKVNTNYTTPHRDFGRSLGRSMDCRRRSIDCGGCALGMQENFSIIKFDKNIILIIEK